MTKYMELCKGRHEIPEAVDGAIFENAIADVTAVKQMEESAMQRLEGVSNLTLYVTGLTVALISVLNACKRLGIKVTLMHFDRATGKYYSQEVL